MQICRKVAGYSYGRADIVRRAMAKKKIDVMQKERIGFTSGAVDNGIPEKKANEIFDMMVEFAKYAFAKSHAVAYAVVAYKTAYLKCHYPKEYMCALLNSVSGETGKIKEYIDDCSRMGISILPPDINESGEKFTVSGKNLRFGLVAVKNVGWMFAKKLIEERSRKPFSSIEDFLTRVHSFGNTRMIESLIMCGALDSFGIYRSRLISELDNALSILSRQKNANIEGQMGLFDGSDVVCDGKSVDGIMLKLDFRQINEYSLLERLSHEKSLTGLYFSGHPLDKYQSLIKSIQALTTKQLLSGLSDRSIKDKKLINFVALVTKKRAKVTKSNTMMAFITAEDLYGEAEIIVFPALYEEFGGAISEGEIYVFACEATLKESFSDDTVDELKLLLKSVRPVTDFEGDINPALYLKITDANRSRLEDALEIIRDYPGKSRVKVFFDKEKKLRAAKDLNCCVSDKLISNLKLVLGEKNVATK